MSITARAKRARLRRSKLLATALLACMVVLFIVSLTFKHTAPWLAYVQAFAEAALVGGLADWFAVTALFRHPLGLPIPHTAILVRRKNAIGHTLARFVEDNFLTRTAVSGKLEHLDFVVHAAQWLERDDNRHKVSSSTAALAAGVGRLMDAGDLRGWLSDNMRTGIRSIAFAPLAGRILEAATRDQRHNPLLDAAVRVGCELLEQNRHAIRHRVGERSPWWLPKFIDEQIFQKLMRELEEVLQTLGQDPQHPARHHFNDRLRTFIDDLKNDPQYYDRGEAIKHQLLAHPEMEAYLSDLVRDFGAAVAGQLRDPHSALYRRFEQQLSRVFEVLLAQTEVRNELNNWIKNGVLFIVSQYRREIGALISETVKSWDAKPTARRIELEVGHDLQMIRINGTLVGAIVGLVIYSLSLWV